MAWEKIPISQLVSAHLPEQQAFWLLGVDVTPNPRPYAKTLSDRGYVYAPNPVAGNKPITNREERWWHLVHIAYTMLWMARHLAQYLPRPWEKYLPASKNKNISPTLVRRDFERLIQQLGTPAQPPKPRGKSPGRTKGTKLQPRPRQFVVNKSKNRPSPG